jgi:uncharacterized protein (DUF1800 family)
MQTELLTPSDTLAAQTDTATSPSASPDNSPQSTHLAPAALSLLAAALLAACGGGGGGTSGSTGVGSAPGFNNYPKANNDEEAARFLQQSQFSSGDADISAVRGGDFAGYLQQQFDKPVGQTGWDWLDSKGYGVADANNYFFTDYPARFMLWNQLMTAPDSMRKRIALALSEFFVISMQSDEFTWRSHGLAAYWDILAKNAFGNYRQLLEDVTLSPAMGYYLNTKGNLKEDPTRGRLPDENYGREVMQLFSIGLYQLNNDGTEKLDANGKKIDTYAASDVSNIAKMFTGYDFDTSDGVQLAVVGQTYKISTKDFARKPMSLKTINQSISGATFLGVSVPAGTKDAAPLKIALDTLFNHSNVGPFFAKQMIQRLVTSNPSPAYVARVAAAFNNNGAGVRGDLKAVWTAILLDDEARGPQGLADPRFGKLREPMLRFVQWGRSFGLNSAGGYWKMDSTSDAASSLGQSPFNSPSVFNFFRPGFVPPSTEMAKTATPAPEFQLVNETTVGGYLNYMQGVIRNGISVSDPAIPNFVYKTYVADIMPSYVNELALVGDAVALVKRLNLILCAGQLSAASQTTIANALGTPAITSASTPAQKLDRVAAAVLLVMACSEYLVQK